MLEPVVHPWWARLADQAHAHLERAGAPLVSLEPEALVASARRRAGLDDFGGDGLREGLEALCASARDDADLNLFGRVALNTSILRALTQRLRRTRLHATHPAIFDAPLNAPVIVVGLPRSGTTHLHRLLAALPGSRALRTWELHEPIPGPGPDLRRKRVQLTLDQVRRAAPHLDAKHHVDADQPEECVLLHDDTLQSISFWMLFPVYGYLEWLDRQDPAVAYAAYREYLQIFQAATPEARLVLKAPAHAAHLAALRQAVPEATVVHTHRDPVPVVGSISSLFHTIHSVVSRSVDDRRTAAVNLEALACCMERSLTQRDDAVVDVDYDDLVADGAREVRRVCEATGLRFDEAVVADALEDRAQHRFGPHPYSLAEVGLTEDAVRRRFARYIAARLGPGGLRAGYASSRRSLGGLLNTLERAR